MCAQSIGALSAATDTPVATIRYYEEIGLLPQAERGRGGQRLYSDADVRRLAFVRSRRALGFSIAEVRALLAASGPDTGVCDPALAAAQLQLGTVRDRIAALRVIEAELVGQIGACADRCVTLRDDSCALTPDVVARQPPIIRRRNRAA